MKKWLKSLGVTMSIILVVSGIVGYGSSSTVEAKAGTKFTVKLSKCIDGDTAQFSKVGKTRFLYIDTPESTTKVEPYGKESAAYTCNLLKKAKTIHLQYDGPKKDKYNRTLAWVWVDGKLIQKEIIKKGYVKQFYDYGTYSYESELRALQVTAMKNKVGMWKGSNTKPEIFANCTELRKKYPNGVPKGHKAYQAKLDRDKDGYACEK